MKSTDSRLERETGHATVTDIVYRSACSCRSMHVQCAVPYLFALSRVYCVDTYQPVVIKEYSGQSCSYDIKSALVQHDIVTRYSPSHNRRLLDPVMLVS